MLPKLLLAMSILVSLSSVGCKKESADKTEAAPAAVEVTPSPAEAAKPDQSADEPELPTGNDEPSAAIIAKPFFYTVKGPEGQAGYLLGTMHMGVDAAKELPTAVWDALAASKSLTIEADITDVKIAMGLMLPKGQNLKDVLGEETWALLVEKLGEPTAKMLLPMKPAAAAATLAVKGLPMTVPMDLALLNQARESDKTLTYLEDAAFQLAMLDKVMNADTVREMLTNPEATDMKTMLATYRSGDEKALLREMENTTSLGENGAEKLEALLFDRNSNWIPMLEELFATKGAFVAVGAAHLIGPRSVVDLLTKKGYTIERFGE